MRKLHFFKARSRLGLLNKPYYGSTTYNTGVEMGADAVLSEDFLAEIQEYKMNDYTFPKPEEIQRQDYYEVLAKHSDLFAKQILTKEDEFIQVVVGGDHSVAYPSLLSVLAKKDPSTTGLIMLDSHGDLHNLSSTPSGNFHAMWLRPLLDNFDEPAIDKLSKWKLPASNVIYIGNLVLEEEESKYMLANGIRNITRTDIQLHTDEILLEVEQFVKKMSHIHISFDIDVFDMSLASATGTPSPNGLFEEEAFPVLNVLAKMPGISVDLVEVNPVKEGAESTIALAQRVLRSLLS